MQYACWIIYIRHQSWKQDLWTHCQEAFYAKFPSFISRSALSALLIFSSLVRIVASGALGRCTYSVRKVSIFFRARLSEMGVLCSTPMRAGGRTASLMVRCEESVRRDYSKPPAGNPRFSTNGRLGAKSVLQLS